MKWAMLVCYVRGHNFRRWRKVPMLLSAPAHRERWCRRCGLVESSPARTRMAAKRELKEVA